MCLVRAAVSPSSSVSPDSSHAAAAPQPPPRRLPVAPPPFFDTAAVHPRCHRRRAPAPFSHASRTAVPRRATRTTVLRRLQPPSPPPAPHAATTAFLTAHAATPPLPHALQPTQPRRLRLSRRSSTRSALTRCSTNCLFEMGREKRKGKEVVVEKPARKRTRAEKEADRAEMVAKAAEEQASGRARPFQIREDPRGRGRGRGRGMGQRQRCQGHQSRDSSSSDRFRWF